jgi:hypothetical protein
MPARHPIALPAALLLSTASLACTVVAACAFLLVALVLLGGHESVVLNEGARAAWCAAAGCACATVAALIALTRASGGLQPWALAAAWAFAFAWPLWGVPAAAAATVATAFAVHWGAGGERGGRFDLPLAALLAVLALLLLGEAFGGASARTDLLAGDPRAGAARVDARASDADGASNDDTRTDGADTDSAGTDRAQTDGSGTDGARTDQAGTNTRLTDDEETDGASTDGAQTDERGTDGGGTDGSATDGASTDEPGTDAGRADDQGTDGASTDEPGTDAGRADPGTGGAGTKPESDGAEGLRGSSARPAAETVVRSYYRALDRKDFYGAWALLSPAVRTSFGGFEHWRAGFAATLSSRPTALRVSGGTVELTLVARDGAECGVLEQRFAVRWQLEAGRAAAITAARAGAPTCSPS